MGCRVAWMIVCALAIIAANVQSAHAALPGAVPPDRRDVDGDGLDDVLVDRLSVQGGVRFGRRGLVLVYGKRDMADVELAAPGEAMQEFDAPWYIRQASIAGDITGDGLADVVAAMLPDAGRG